MGSAEPSSDLGGDSSHDGVPEAKDFERAGLLEGLSGEERGDRLALLHRLAADGVSLSELERGAAEGTLMFLAAERVIGGEGRYTATELAGLSGEPVSFLLAARRAMGLPVPAADEHGYIDADLEAVRMAGLFRAAGISDAEILETLRILGRGLSQSAEAIRALALRLVIEPGVSEHELARRYAAAAAELGPALGPLVAHLLTLHLRQIADSEAINAAERAGGRLPGSREIAVCFADLVGFTRLGEEVSPGELSQLAVRLEELASAAAEPPVRLIKTIGDAVMLTSVEPRPLLDVALSLVDAADAEGEQFPQLRAGVAMGAALSRAGDWFGRPVNLASRITAVARPGSLLVDVTLREAVADERAYRWSYAGERRLRGVRGATRLYRVRRGTAVA